MHSRILLTIGLSMAASFAISGMANAGKSRSLHYQSSFKLPKAYPSIGNGPAPREVTRKHRSRLPKAAPSVGSVPTSIPTFRVAQKPTRKPTAKSANRPAAARSPVQDILPNQLLALLDIAFQRFDKTRTDVALASTERNKSTVAKQAPENTVENAQSALALALVRNLINSINQANLTNEYAVLWKQLTLSTQSTVKPSDLAEQLKSIRALNLDLTETLVKQPEILSKVSERDGVSILLAEGQFTDTARKVEFIGEFQRTNDVWRIQTFRVNVPPLAPSKTAPES